MALIGGGGAPNVVGGSPAGTGTGINYVGNHVYAYSGGAPANTTPVTALDFTTGNEYIVGELTLSLAIQDEAASTAVAISNVDLNGELSFNLLAGFSGADSAPSDSIKILIPPQSRFTANLYSDENQSARFMTLVFTGRVYA